MTTMSVVIPSYRPDLEVFADLHASVLQCTPEAVVHHVVVPDRDAAAFTALRCPRCRIWQLSELIPRRFLAVPRVNSWLNVRRPWPPVRGWVMQQMGKLALVERLESDVVVLVDSDVIMARPVTGEMFLSDDGSAMLYRKPAVIGDTMPRHKTWHAVARDLLGLREEAPPFDDYVNALTVWDPTIVRKLLAHVEAITGRPWLDSVGAQLHFSEDILYGVFADEVLHAAGPRVACPSPCRCYWDTAPLSPGEAVQLACGLAPDDVAVLISSKSHTPLATRRAAWAELHRVLLEDSA